MFKKNFYKTCCDARYQIVLMDINMPVMNGIDSAKGITAIQDEYFKNPSLTASQMLTRSRATILAMTAFSNKKTV